MLAIRSTSARGIRVIYGVLGLLLDIPVRSLPVCVKVIASTRAHRERERERESVRERERERDLLEASSVRYPKEYNVYILPKGCEGH